MMEQHSYDIRNCSIIRNGKAEYGKTVKVRNGGISSIEDGREEWVDLTDTGAAVGGGQFDAEQLSEEQLPLSAARKRQTDTPGVKVYNAGGNWLLPGFVELHIHGCGNLSLEQSTADGSMLHRMCGALSEYGINTFLPTLQANEAALSRLGGELSGNRGDARELQERIPGLYIEGPFVHPEKRGGILPEHIKKPDPGILKRMQEKAGGAIRLMTVAPELEGIDRIMDLMDDLGIIPCFGHSTASADRARAIADERYIHLTHLFNAMSPLSHRDPGLAMLPFLSNTVSFELNGDGVHVHPDMLRMCWRHLNREKMVLISDAVVSAGKPAGEYSYFGKRVVSGGNGVRYRDSGVLVGSHLLIPQVAAAFRKAVGADFSDIVPLLTKNPLSLLFSAGGTQQDTGRGLLTVGAPADLILVDENFQLLRNFHPYSRSLTAA